MHGYYQGSSEVGLVMEWCGTTLADVIRSNSLVDLTDQASKLLDAAKGLMCLHTKHVAHGDVKPENFLIGPDGRVKIADFGSSRISATMATQTFAGSLHYAAPEAFEGKGSLPADIWSLGMVVYAVLTTKTPFAGKSMAELARSLPMPI